MNNGIKVRSQIDSLFYLVKLAKTFLVSISNMKNALYLQEDEEIVTLSQNVCTGME